MTATDAEEGLLAFGRRLKNGEAKVVWRDGQPVYIDEALRRIFLPREKENGRKVANAGLTGEVERV